MENKETKVEKVEKVEVDLASRKIWAKNWAELKTKASVDVKMQGKNQGFSYFKMSQVYALVKTAIKASKSKITIDHWFDNVKIEKEGKWFTSSLKVNININCGESGYCEKLNIISGGKSFTSSHQAVANAITYGLRNWYIHTFQIEDYGTDKDLDKIEQEIADGQINPTPKSLIPTKPTKQEIKIPPIRKAKTEVKSDIVEPGGIALGTKTNFKADVIDRIQLGGDEAKYKAKVFLKEKGISKEELMTSPSTSKVWKKLLDFLSKPSEEPTKEIKEIGSARAIKL